MKKHVESIYFLKTSVFPTEENAWKTFKEWSGYNPSSHYFIIKTKEWWDVYQIF